MNTSHIYKYKKHVHYIFGVNDNRLIFNMMDFSLTSDCIKEILLMKMTESVAKMRNKKLNRKWNKKQKIYEDYRSIGYKLNETIYFVPFVHT